MMALIDTVKPWVLENLPYNRADPEVVAVLEAKHPAELLVIYANWQSRFVRPQPREVLRSPAFDTNPVVAERRAAIDEIMGDIKTGNLLTKYLSKDVDNGFVLPRNQKKKRFRGRKDLDLLLNDWGVHHLHTNTAMGADGFVVRSGPLIFAVFKPTRAYLIDVMKHGDWTRDHVVRVMVETWPEEGLARELRGIIAPPNERTEKDRSDLRSVGISSFVNMNGRAYMPSLGITTAGTSTAVSMDVMKVMRTLKGFQELLDTDPTKVFASIRAHGGQLSEQPEFRFAVFEEGGYGVVETNSQAKIRLG
jgi:hypothetical protein